MKVFGVWVITERGTQSYSKVRANSFEEAIKYVSQEKLTIYRIELLGIEENGAYYSLTFKEK